jgi:hypothetical protein
MPSKHAFSLISIFCITALGGCAYVTNIPIPEHLIERQPEKSPVELQAIQSREFDANKEELISVFIGVFQDLGYTLNQTSVSAGLITATTPVQVKQLTVNDVFAHLPVPILEVQKQMSVVQTLNTYRTISVLISPIGDNRTRARVSLVVNAAISDPGFLPYQGVETDTTQYQLIFQKVQQGLFLKRNLK